MKEKRAMKGYGGMLAVILLALDQITKYYAVHGLSGSGGVSLIPGVFQFYYLENRGAAFGIMADRQWFFVLVALVMTIAAAYVYLRLPRLRHYLLLRVVCILVAAGALGNMLDRILHNYVIDFLYFSLIDFPVFNVADIYVCVGAALGVIGAFTIYRDEDFHFLTAAKRERGTADEH